MYKGEVNKLSVLTFLRNPLAKIYGENQGKYKGEKSLPADPPKLRSLAFPSFFNLPLIAQSGGKVRLGNYLTLGKTW